MKWCCVGFKAHYDHAGQRGSAILIGRDLESAPEFVLQHRILDADEVWPKDAPAHVVLVSDERIQFCPWCGTNLDRFYGKQVDALTKPGLRIGIRVTEPSGR